MDVVRTILDLGDLPADIPYDLSSPSFTIFQGRHGRCHPGPSVGLGSGYSHLDGLGLSKSVNHMKQYTRSGRYRERSSGGQCDLPEQHGLGLFLISRLLST